MIFVTYLGRLFFPDIAKFFINYYFWVVYLLFVIGLCYKDYKDIKDYSEHLDMIYQTKKEKMSHAKLDKYSVWASVFAEIHKTKLDMLKTFSPIPIIIFILGIYVNNSTSISNQLSLFSIELKLGDLLMYSGIGIPVFYFYFIYSTFTTYKKHMRKYMDFKGEAIVVKEENKELSKYLTEDKDSA